MACAFKLSVIGVTLALVTSAQAEPTAAQRDKARQLADAGAKHYRLHELEAAAADFKESYSLVPTPALLFNLGQTYRQLHQNAEAIYAYKQYLYLNAAQIAPSVRVAIQERIDELGALVEQQQAADNAQPIGSAPPEAPPPRPAVDALRPRWYSSALGWSLLGGGLTVCAVGAGLRAHGADLDGQIGDASTLAQAGRLTYDRDRFNPAGVTLLAVGGAATVASIVVFTVVAKRSKSSLRADAARGPGGLR